MSTINHKRTGFSLLEILVVIAVFSVLAVLSLRSLLLTLRGTTKSEALARARANIDYSFTIIERNLHNARSVTCLSSTEISYEDEDEIFTSFSCENIGTKAGHIASGSAKLRLTTDKVNVTACSFACEPGGVGVPPSVVIKATAEDAGAFGVEGAQVTAETKILLRTY